MNYTLIAYTEDGSYHDRCGDYIHHPGSFETFFTKDREELINTWADWSFNRNFESLELLLNGAPSSELNDEEDRIYDELDDARRNKCEILKQEKSERDRLAELQRKEAAARKAELEAHMQWQRDLQTLEQLKKKLGIN